MEGTELSCDIPSTDKNNIKVSNYSKISTEEELYIDPSDIKFTKEEPVPNIENSKNSFYNTAITIEKSKQFCCSKLGNTYALLGDREGNPLFIIGPHWPMYICLNGFVSGGFLLFFGYFWSYLNIFFKLLGLIIFGVFNGSYTYTFLINPGYPKHDLESKTGEPRNKFRYCGECKMWVNIEKHVSHCFECNICVEGYDHHCPWTGKCIGKYNLISFYVFVVSILFVFTYFILAVTNAQSNMSAERKRKKNSGRYLEMIFNFIS